MAHAVTGASVEILRVVLVPPLGRVAVLDYAPPDGVAHVEPGTRVLVSVGSRRMMGVVESVLTDTPHRARLKAALAVLDPEPVLDRALLRLVRWMGEYYLAPLGDAITTALPGSLRIETERQAVLAEPPTAVEGTGVEREILTCLHQNGAQSVAGLERRFGDAGRRALARLRRRQIIRVVERLRREVAPTRHARWYEAVAGAEPALGRRPALRQIFEYLRDHPLRRATAVELRASFPAAAAKLKALMAAGLVRCREEEQYRTVLPPVVHPDRPVTLTAPQSAAVAAITEAMTTGFGPFLLWGVTGSGKTEVYLRAMAAVLAAQRTALILVPEISLTHQLVDRVRARFGDRVAVLHSQLSTGERWDEWRRIARGEAPIVIGARSAIFAPLRRIGLIIVDEEHDSAYKQADGVRYHGRDVAVMRAKLDGCPVVLGSATPSMESFHNAQTGRYRLLELPERVASRPLPAVQTIDLRNPHARAPEALAPPLAAALAANLMAGGQSLVFLNRRGFATVLQCRACGDPVMCPNCSVTLTWHRQWRAARCHYCDHTIPPPARCPGCGEPALDTWGLGTEQLEMLLRDAFPGARIGRMDRDTTRRKGSQAALLNAWAAGTFDILIGTQMVTKGHDVPGVTLVGVILADQSLNFPDFRAAEQTFQLLTQVAGRAGRGDQPGRVVVQTLQPHHYSLRAAQQHDFAAFAREELEARRELDYPPFARLVMLRIEGAEPAAVEHIAREAAARLRDLAGGRFGVLGPAPAPLERIRQRHRWQILLRGRSGAALRRAVAEVLPALQPAARQRAVFVRPDVDPYGML